MASAMTVIGGTISKTVTDSTNTQMETSTAGCGRTIRGKATVASYQPLGTISHNNGDKYEGEWVNDTKNGLGISCIALGDYYCSDGNKYSGSWKDDKINGEGTYYYTNGEIYFGDWVDGQREGKGIFYYVNGNRYDGEWVDGQRHGTGVVYFDNGDKYEGQWRHDEMTDEGSVECMVGVMHSGEVTRRDGTFETPGETPS
eukprot:TRINITY_DN4143_c0_g4_i1.p1 TRINITY_DN4143_c0_g4~~TRINITY_DN4143_c0_g4_i1.p1  ORF type:complete len:200 (-),score=34.23 TRINITY_DN4143_c0_g4_i1:153-752(-)